jgi:hypothetical protein
MKMIILAVVVLAVFALTGMAADAGKKSGKLRHVVAFKYKETTSPADQKKVADGIRALTKKVKVVKDFEWGINNSPENLNKGFTHGFILTFASEEDRKTYLDHPEHKKFVEMAMPLIGDVFVIDFWSEK